jgi:hypothetical protein
MPDFFVVHHHIKDALLRLVGCASLFVHSTCNTLILVQVHHWSIAAGTSSMTRLGKLHQVVLLVA